MDTCKARVRSANEALERAERSGNSSEIRSREWELWSAEKRLDEVVERTMEPRSTGLMATGIVLTCAGGAAVLAGLVIGLEGADFSGLGGGSGDPFPPASIAALIGGFVGLAVGIPTTIIGGRRVPKNRSSAEAGPLLLVGPKGASLRVLF